MPRQEWQGRHTRIHNGEAPKAGSSCSENEGCDRSHEGQRTRNLFLPRAGRIGAIWSASGYLVTPLFVWAFSILKAVFNRLPATSGMHFANTISIKSIESIRNVAHRGGLIIIKNKSHNR